MQKWACTVKFTQRHVSKSAKMWKAKWCIPANAECGVHVGSRPWQASVLGKLPGIVWQLQKSAKQHTGKATPNDRKRKRPIQKFRRESNMRENGRESHNSHHVSQQTWKILTQSKSRTLLNMRKIPQACASPRNNKKRMPFNSFPQRMPS